MSLGLDETLGEALAVTQISPLGAALVYLTDRTFWLRLAYNNNKSSPAPYLMEDVVINWLAVVAAAVVGFVIGGLWYSPLLFGNPWMREAGVTEEHVNGGNKAKIFGSSLVFLLVMSYCLAMFMAAPDITLQTGAFYGFLTGFGWIFFAIGVVALFEMRSWTYIFINGGYWVVTMTVMGAILGGWK